jgi:hypothetical protein
MKKKINGQLLQKCLTKNRLHLKEPQNNADKNLTIT